MINTIRPEFFSKNIKNAIKKRQEIEQVKKMKEIVLTNTMHQLIMTSEHLTKSKFIINFDNLLDRLKR